MPEAFQHGARKQDKPDKVRHVPSMHERLDPEWSDPICCCEAEPRWQALGEQLEAEASARTQSEDRKPKRQ